MRRSFGIKKPFMLVHINACCETIVEVCRSDVELMHVHS